MKILAFLLAYVPLIAAGQVNFEKGPENTDCHLIESEYPDVSSYITEIRQRSFRYVETMKVSSYRSPRMLEYYSCDGKSGFVVAITGDSSANIHPGVPITVWKGIPEQEDILTYYSTTFLENYPSWKPGITE